MVTLRSGKTLGVSRVTKKHTVTRASLESLVEDRCFGVTWPTLESARKLSISTNDPIEFHQFCYKVLHKVDNKKCKFINRLYALALVESLYQCGSHVLTKYYRVIQVMYEKLQNADCFIAPDMRRYINKLKVLMDQYSVVSPVA